MLYLYVCFFYMCVYSRNQPGGWGHRLTGFNAPPVHQIVRNFVGLNTRRVTVNHLLYSCIINGLLLKAAELLQAAASNCLLIRTAARGPPDGAYTLLYAHKKKNVFSSICGNRWSNEGYLMSPVQHVSKRINFASLSFLPRFPSCLFLFSFFFFFRGGVGEG